MCDTASGSDVKLHNVAERGWLYSNRSFGVGLTKVIRAEEANTGSFARAILVTFGRNAGEEERRESNGFVESHMQRIIGVLGRSREGGNVRETEENQAGKGDGKFVFRGLLVLGLEAQMKAEEGKGDGGHKKESR